MARRILPDSGVLRLVQDGVFASADEIKSIPILNGVLLEDVALISGTTKVPHRLGRRPRGYLVAKSTAAIDVYDTGTTTTDIDLVSSAAATVSLWIF